MDTTSWSTQQLAEFLEIFAAQDRDPMLLQAVDRVAESLDAEMVVLILRGEVIETRGFRAGRVPEADLLGLAAGDAASAELPGLEPVAVARVAVANDDRSMLLVGRISGPLDREERMLLRSMGRAMGLSVANADLVGRLAERYTLSARLLDIQRSISHRAPLQEVLDRVTEGAAALLDADVVGLAVSLDENETERFTSIHGVDDRLRGHFATIPLDSGFAGRAFTLDRLMVTDDYGAEPDKVDRDGVYGTRAAMAAPVHRGTDPVGVLSVASRESTRRFSDAEQEVLLMFAQHVSLAVNDASAVRDIRHSLHEAEFEATHDSLTGLLNRSAVLEKLPVLLSRASPANPVSVLFVDIDRFKMVNDLFGHAAGDAVLVAIAQRLSEVVRPEDIVARQAGDEFLVVSDSLPAGAAGHFATRLIEAMRMPFDIGGRELTFTVSIGVAQASGHRSAAELLSDADVAMYRAKQQGRSAVMHFDSEMRIEMLERSEVERELHAAIRDRSGLVVHHQPIHCLDSREIIGFEALIRWEHPERGLLSAAEFVPIAEESGQIGDIDRLVLEEATHQLARWRSMSPALEHLTMSVNVSGGWFRGSDLLRDVGRALDASGLPAEALWLEITETTLMEKTTMTMSTLDVLSRHGVGISIDDFGTGYSSLAYLKQFPVTNLKIDQTFVSGVCDSPNDEAIVNAVILMARALGLTTIAEGVETPEQLAWLAEQGCELGQGYLLSRPAPVEVIEELLLRQMQDA